MLELEKFKVEVTKSSENIMVVVVDRTSGPETVFVRVNNDFLSDVAKDILKVVIPTIINLFARKDG